MLKPDRRTLARQAAALASLHRSAQGLAGVVCIAAGMQLIAGTGVMLVIVGAFLLFAAWAGR